MAIKMPDPKKRWYFYLLAAGVLVILKGYGMITDEEQVMWTDFLMLLFGFSPLVAAANVEKPGPYDHPQDVESV